MCTARTPKAAPRRRELFMMDERQGVAGAALSPSAAGEARDAVGSLAFTVPFFAARPVTSSDTSTACSSDDVSDGIASEPRPTKKRKPTYIARKEERETLEAELHRLESQLTVLQSHTTGEPGSADALQKSVAANRVLGEVVRHQQFALAASQSMLSQCLGEQRTFPLYSHIHLGKDWGQRRETLMALKNPKLLQAIRYVIERTGDLDLLKPHLSDERFEDSDGGYSCMRFEIIQFDGVESLKQVYDAALFYFMNMEISISERLGHLTVREDYDLLENNIYNFRMLSDDENGVSTEMNTVSFAHLFDIPDSPGERMAVFVSDCVDSDELFPFTPDTRVRKDISGTVVFTAHRRSNSQGSTSTTVGDNGGDLVVVMRRAAFLRLHPAHFDVPPMAVQEMREGIARWGDVMLKTIRELVYPKR